MANIKWNLIQVKASELKPNPKNPKIRDDDGFERLKHSLDKFGRIYDGIANKDLSLIDGHSRLETAEPNDVLNIFVPNKQLSENEYKELNAMFDIAKAGEPDYEIIFEELDEDTLMEWNLFEDQNTEITTEEVENNDNIPIAKELGFSDKYIIIRFKDSSQYRDFIIDYNVPLEKSPNFQKDNLAEIEMKTVFDYEDLHPIQK